MARLKWLATARPNQLLPEGDWWSTWLLQAGRGFGKTRVGAETTIAKGLGTPNLRIAVVAPTREALRKVCFDGESGIMNLLPQICRGYRGKLELYNKTTMELTLHNGTIIQGFSADTPNRLRGPQHHFAWCDEVGSWRYPEDTWDQLQFGLRLGTNPQSIITTTPVASPLLIQLNDQLGKDVVMTIGSTFDNSAHLSARQLARLKERYEGTRLGDQELYAKLLRDVKGALWTLDGIEKSRVRDRGRTEFSRIVVAIDPAVSQGLESAETGIVVCGLAADGTYWVLDDLSDSYSPDGWASAAVEAYHRWQADRIIGEVNNGGDMIESILRSKAPDVPYRAVHATRGKYRRAEPVAALWEQGKGRFLGSFGKLESQCRTYVPRGPGSPQESAAKSPDRMDAMVWAITDLLNVVPDEPMGAAVQVGSAR